jgi:hypothetical protein
MADKGIFTPRNPKKYLGNNINNIIARSSWEWSVMMRFDQGPDVLHWMNESLPTNHVHNGISGIPYQNPLRPGSWTIYVPDFWVQYIDRHGKQHVEVIEVKPLDEVPVALSGFTGKVSSVKQAKQIVNAAKFAAGMKYCVERGWQFKFVTENQLFGYKR